MLKLILRLLSLFSSLLLLNQGVCILGFTISLSCDLLTMWLSTLFVLRRRLLCLLSISGCTWLLYWYICNLRGLSLTSFEILVVLASNAQRFLSISLINDVHALALIWKSVDASIATVLSSVGSSLCEVLAQQPDCSTLLLHLICLRLSL
jgi:hypothetical protein